MGECHEIEIQTLLGDMETFLVWGAIIEFGGVTSNIYQPGTRITREE